MKKEEAKRRVLAEWRRWWEDHRGDRTMATGEDAFNFYNELDLQGSSLLEFRDSGDRYQTIKGWLLQARLVSG